MILFVLESRSSGVKSKVIKLKTLYDNRQSVSLVGAEPAVVASLLLYLSTLAGAKALHSKTLLRLMHCPMAFFDTTPQGRIINRFSKVRGWW